MAKKIPEPRVRSRPVNELLTFLSKDRVQKQPPKLKIYRIKRVQRKYSDKYRQLVVFLRYGSLTDFSTLRLRWVDIARRTGIFADTCKEMVYGFHRRGNSAKRTYSTGRKPFTMPDDVSEYLRTSLLENRFLSITERCRIIQ